MLAHYQIVVTFAENFVTIVFGAKYILRIFEVKR